MTPEEKCTVILEHGKAFRLNVFVETGTYWGNTVEAMRGHFSEIYSIELSPELYENAKKRFSMDSGVHLFLGDSGKILREIIPALAQRPLFWLDAHYSEGCTARGTVDTPIVQELEAILNLCPHGVVLIDDAWAFGTDSSYPKLEELRLYIAKKAPDWRFEVKDEIIRLY